MALILNEEQELLRDSARTFLEERSPVSSLRALRDAGEEWSEELWNEMAEMGWSGIIVPEEYGGLEFGFVGAGLLAEECGRTLASSPLIASALVSASLVGSLGTDHQKAELLPAIASGELVLSLALNEPGKTGPQATALAAVADRTGYLLNGDKSFVLDATHAHRYLVVARTTGAAGDQAGLSVFVVDAKADGLEVSTTLNADNHRPADLHFEQVRVPADALLGVAGAAWSHLELALDIGAICASAELLGIAEESFARTVGYLKERKQFGVPVGSFQSLHHRTAILFSELHLCRSIVLSALQSIDENRDDRALMASLAKTKCGRTAKLAVNEAVQMHAGIGMTDEFEIGFFMKRAASVRQEYGDEYFHADRFARLRGY